MGVPDLMGKYDESNELKQTSIRPLGTAGPDGLRHRIVTVWLLCCAMAGASACSACAPGTYSNTAGPCRGDRHERVWLPHVLCVRARACMKIVYTRGQ